MNINAIKGNTYLQLDWGKEKGADNQDLSLRSLTFTNERN